MLGLKEHIYVQGMSSHLQFCWHAHQMFFFLVENFIESCSFCWTRYSRALLWGNGIYESSILHFFLQMSSNKYSSPKLRRSLQGVERSQFQRLNSHSESEVDWKLVRPSRSISQDFYALLASEAGEAVAAQATHQGFSIGGYFVPKMKQNWWLNLYLCKCEYRYSSLRLMET